MIPQSRIWWFISHYSAILKWPASWRQPKQTTLTRNWAKCKRSRSSQKVLAYNKLRRLKRSRRNKSLKPKMMGPMQILPRKAKNKHKRTNRTTKLRKIKFTLTVLWSQSNRFPRTALIPRDRSQTSRTRPLFRLQASHKTQTKTKPTKPSKTSWASTNTTRLVNRILKRKRWNWKRREKPRRPITKSRWFQETQ